MYLAHPDLSNVLQELKKDCFYNFNAHQIGIIESFNSENQTASVKIALKRIIFQDIDGTRKFQEYPLLINCPCIVIGGGAGSLQMPIAQGDECLILFNDREIDNWFESGEISQIDSLRAHDLSDGICLVGLKSLKNSYVDYRDDAVKLIYDNSIILLEESKISITTLEEISLIAPLIGLAGAVEIAGALDVTGAITAGNGATGTFDTITVASGIVTGGGSLAPYTLGSILYGNAENELAKLSGNTTTSRKYLVQTGDGVNSAAPEWFELSESILNHALLSNLNSTNYYHLTEANHIDLTDGGDSALHWHPISNSAKADIDTLIYGTSSIPLVFCDAGNNKIGINTITPSTLLDVDGDSLFNKSKADKDFTIYGTDATNPLIFCDASAMLVSIYNNLGIGGNSFGGGTNVFALTENTIPSSSISDGILQYTSRQVVDNYTKILMHFTGSNGSTTIIDDVGHTVTAYGNAQISTAYYKFSPSSCKFDGNGDYLLSTSTDYAINTQPFTMEFFFKLNSLSYSTYRYIMTIFGDRFGLFIDKVSQKLYFISYSYWRIASLAALNTSEWYHVAIVGNGSSITMYLNGVAQGTWAGYDTYTDTVLCLGGYYYGPVVAEFDGYIDEFSLQIGYAKYTSNFTPPSSPLSIYGGTCLSLRSSDDSTICLGSGITQAINDLIIKNITSDKDIIFSGNVGGTQTELARFDVSSNRFGIGTTAPDRKFEINDSSGNCLRLTYNDANGSASYYTDFLVDATGKNTQNAIAGFGWQFAGVEQISLIDGVLKPTNTNDIDLGTSSLLFKDLWQIGKHYFRDSALGVYSQADSFLDIFADGGLRIGDSSAGAPTNYTKFGSNGFITLHGTARRKQQYRIHAGSSAKGVSAPSDYLRAIGASGGVKKPVLQFSNVSQQDIYFEIHCPEDLDSSENPEFHLMWIPGASWTSGNYRWVLEYIVKYEDASYGDANTTTGTPTTIYMDVTPSNSYDLIETKFTDKFIGVAEDKLIVCHLYRDVANDNANDVGEVNFFEFTYISNKLGEEL